MSFDPGFPASLVLENPTPLQGTGADHFVLAESFEGGGREAGDGNRVAQCVEDFDGISLGAVRSHVMVHQLHDVAATEPSSGTSASTIEWLKRATVSSSRLGMNFLQMKQIGLCSHPSKLNCAEVAPNVPIDSLQTL